MTIESFPAFVVRKDDQGQVYSGIEQLDLDQLHDGDVLVRVRYSSLNYKDALAASGHPGVVRTFPHVPGVDAAGTVVEDVTGSFSPGSEVIVTGYDLGGAHWGGYAEYIRVPVGWLVPLPAGLSLEESMILGTAGFTAAQSVQALIHHAVGPQSGPVVVTGASGGVGCLSVAILARLGYEVVAVTGKPDAHDFLRQLGAAHVIGRDEVTDDGRKPPACGALGRRRRHGWRSRANESASLNPTPRLRDCLRSRGRHRLAADRLPFHPPRRHPRRHRLRPMPDGLAPRNLDQAGRRVEAG